jgi:hypothetical protein
MLEGSPLAVDWLAARLLNKLATTTMNATKRSESELLEDLDAICRQLLPAFRRTFLKDDSDDR